MGVGGTGVVGVLRNSNGSAVARQRTAGRKPGDGLGAERETGEDE